MKINDILQETTTSASIATSIGSIGGMQKRNPDGTAINALDQQTPIFGNKKPKKKKTDK